MPVTFDDLRRYVSDVCLKANQDCAVIVKLDGANGDEYEITEVRETHRNGTACLEMYVAKKA